MITEKTLRKWRKDALQSLYSYVIDVSPEAIILHQQERDERILRLTQELLDAHLMRKG
jgi:hypothetical protein